MKNFSIKNELNKLSTIKIKILLARIGLIKIYDSPNIFQNYMSFERESYVQTLIKYLEEKADPKKELDELKLEIEDWLVDESYFRKFQNDKLLHLFFLIQTQKAGVLIPQIKLLDHLIHMVEDIITFLDFNWINDLLVFTRTDNGGLIQGYNDYQHNKHKALDKIFELWQGYNLKMEGLTWLDKNNTSQLEWLFSYKKGFIANYNFGFFYPEDNEGRYLLFLMMLKLNSSFSVIDRNKTSTTVDRKKFITIVRNAWYQQKNYNAKPKTKKSKLSIKLNKDTLRKVEELAEMRNITERQVIIEAINAVYALKNLEPKMNNSWTSDNKNLSNEN